MKDVAEALQEMLGGSLAGWAAKLLAALAMAMLHILQTATVPIAVFAIMVLADTFLGTLAAAKRDQTIKPWLWVKGITVKCFVGGMLFLCASGFDAVAVGGAFGLTHPLLTIVSGVAMLAMILEVSAKFDFLTGLGVLDKLSEKFPAIFHKKKE